MATSPEHHRTVRRLKNIALFAHLPDEALVELAQKVELRQFEKGQALLRAEDAVDALLVIRSGWAKITTLSPQGQELEISHVGPGGAIGDLSLLDGQPYQVSVFALTPIQADAVLRREFLAWLERRPAYAPDILRGLADKVRLNTAYVQKAIEWSNRIAQGDYSLPMEEINSEHTTVATRARPDEADVAEFLAAFHTMIQGVKTREDTLKQQIQELSIQIDTAKVDQEVDELTDSSFFKNLKAARERLRKPKED
jgi:CRP-like cAMP-binding protein